MLLQLCLLVIACNIKIPKAVYPRGIYQPLLDTKGSMFCKYLLYTFLSNEDIVRISH